MVGALAFDQRDGACQDRAFAGADRAGKFSHVRGLQRGARGRHDAVLDEPAHAVICGGTRGAVWRPGSYGWGVRSLAGREPPNNATPCAERWGIRSVQGTNTV